MSNMGKMVAWMGELERHTFRWKTPKRRNHLDTLTQMEG